MKKISFLLLIIILIFGCTPKNKTEEKNAIKIGAILPLTGSASELALQHKRGLDFAIKELNRKYNEDGYIIKLVLEDDQNDPKKSVAAVNKLIDQDKVIVVITVMSSPSLAIAPILKKHNIPHFANCGNPYITSENSNVFRNFPSTDLEVRTVIDFIKDSTDFKTGAILYIDDAYGKGAEEMSIKLFPKNGIEIIETEAFGKSGTNTKTAAIKVVDKNPDFIYVYGYGKPTANVINNLKEIGFSGQICGSYNFSQPPLTTISRQSIDQSIYTVPTYDKNGEEKSPAFWKNYLKEYNEPPLWNGVIEYDAINIIIKAYLNKPENYTLIESLKTIGDYKGVGGMYHYSDSKDWLLPMSIATSINGEVKYLK